jgi:hypothetical protein
VESSEEPKQRPIIRFNENILSKGAKPQTVRPNKVGTPPELTNSKLMASYSRLAALPAHGIGSGA